MQLFVVVFCTRATQRGTIAHSHFLWHNAKKKKKLTKRGKVHSVLGDIDDGDGAMELTLEQGKVMAQLNSHSNNDVENGGMRIAPRDT